jgi:four helix bundle protein
MRHSTFEPVRLDAYRVARELVVVLARVTKSWTGWSNLADQGKRASVSAMLNVAEGAGFPRGNGNKRRHYEIALASAVEAACAIDAADALGLAVEDAPAIAARTVQLLGGLLRSLR